VATASADRSIKIWDPTNNIWSLIRSYTSHVDNVLGFDIINSEWVVSGAGYGSQSIRVWSTRTGVTNRTIATDSTFIQNIGYNKVSGLKMLPNGIHLACGRLNGNINIFNINTGSQIRTLTGHTLQITDLVLIGNDLLASSSIDSLANVRIWNLASYTSRFILRGHTNAVFGLKLVSPSVLASASTDRTIRLWNIATGTLIRTLSGHTSRVTALDLFSSQIVASGSYDLTLRLWNINTGQFLTSINAGMSIVSLAAFNPIIAGNSNLQ
jgi:WD40 repeat protein